MSITSQVKKVSFPPECSIPLWAPAEVADPEVDFSAPTLCSIGFSPPALPRLCFCLSRSRVLAPLLFSVFDRPRLSDCLSSVCRVYSGYLTPAIVLPPVV